jgi:hypothetical protein
MREKMYETTEDRDLWSEQQEKKKKKKFASGPFSTLRLSVTLVRSGGR